MAFRKYRKRINRIPRIRSACHMFNKDIDAQSGFFLTSGALTIDTSTGALAFGIPNGTTAGTLVYGTFSYYFSPLQIPNLNDYEYDEMKIISWKMTISPMTAPSSGNQGSGQPLVLLHSVIDLEDHQLPTASESQLDTFRRMPYYKKFVFGNKTKTWARKVHSKFRVGITDDTGANTNTMTTGSRKWLKKSTAGFVDIEFNALKRVFEAVATNAGLDFVWYWMVQIQATFCCRMNLT